MKYFERLYNLPNSSFFLFGPRSVGKTTWLRKHLKFEQEINLLENDSYLQYLTNPSKLREVTSGLKPESWVWIDEVQKVPNLLDEVHSLMESKKLKFALSGSSARKLKRLGANLLAGRALTLNMGSLSFAELDGEHRLDDCLSHGTLPLVLNDTSLYKERLHSYVMTYLKEEIQQEGHVRKIEPFTRFLEICADYNANILNVSNIARESQVGRKSVETYFSIFKDTLLGDFLPSLNIGVASKEVKHPKFYWFDTGVVRAASHLLDNDPEKEWLGRSLETIVFNELKLRNYFSAQKRRFYYYRTGQGTEVDFVIELRKKSIDKRPKLILLEVKNSKRWDSRWERGVKFICASDKVEVQASYGLYRGQDEIIKSHIKILPVEAFLKKLHTGDIF